MVYSVTIFFDRVRNLGVKVAADIGFCSHEISDVCTTNHVPSIGDVELSIHSLTGFLRHRPKATLRDGFDDDPGLFSFFTLPSFLNPSTHLTMPLRGEVLPHVLLILFLSPKIQPDTQLSLACLSLSEQLPTSLLRCLARSMRPEDSIYHKTFSFFFMWQKKTYSCSFINFHNKTLKVRSFFRKHFIYCLTFVYDTELQISSDSDKIPKLLYQHKPRCRGRQRRPWNDRRYDFDPCDRNRPRT
jgi:hypothetical protein